MRTNSQLFPVVVLPNGFLVKIFAHPSKARELHEIIGWLDVWGGNGPSAHMGGMEPEAIGWEIETKVWEMLRDRYLLRVIRVVDRVADLDGRSAEDVKRDDE